MGFFNRPGGSSRNRSFDIDHWNDLGSRRGRAVAADDPAAALFATAAASFSFMTGLLDPRITFTRADDNAWYRNSAGAGTPRLQVVDGGTIQCSISSAAPAINTVHKVALTFDTDDFRGNLNGTALSADVLGTLPTVNQLVIGGGLFGWVQEIVYWDPALTTEELDLVATA